MESRSEFSGEGRVGYDGRNQNSAVLNSGVGKEQLGLALCACCSSNVLVGIYATVVEGKAGWVGGQIYDQAVSSSCLSPAVVD